MRDLSADRRGDLGCDAIPVCCRTVDQVAVADATTAATATVARGTPTLTIG